MPRDSAALHDASLLGGMFPGSLPWSFAQPRLRHLREKVAKMGSVLEDLRVCGVASTRADMIEGIGLGNPHSMFCFLRNLCAATSSRVPARQANPKAGCRGSG